MGALNWLFYMAVVYFIYVNVAKKKGKEFLFVDHAIEDNFLPGDVYTAGICYRISIAKIMEYENCYNKHHESN